MTRHDSRRDAHPVLGLHGVGAGLLGVGLSLLLLIAAAPSASAATGYAHIGYLAGIGNTYLEVLGTTPRRVAVDGSTGNVLVANGNNLVKVYAPVGSSGRYRFVTQFGPGGVSSAFGIAVDQSTGSVYVSDPTGNRIVKFETDGAATPAFTVDPAFTSPALGVAAGQVGSFSAGIAVDPESGDLLVADPGNDRITRFGSNGAFVSSFDGATSPTGAFTGVVDLAVAPDGDIVVTDTTGDAFADIIAGASTRVERFDSTGAHQATIGPVAGGAGALAVDPNTGQVLVAGDMASWTGGSAPRINVFAPDGTPMGSAPLVDPPGVGGSIAGLAVKGGANPRLYVVTSNRDGATSSRAVVAAYGPTPAAPGVEATAVVDKDTSTGRLTGKVNPFGLATDYRFEYGADTSYGNTTSPVAVGSGASFKVVARSIDGLQPGTTYHYRIVAENSAGTTVSGDRTFRTLAQPAPRRGYEMVSPADKNSNDISFRTSRSRSSLSGDTATFISSGAFAGAQGVGKVVQYLSERDRERGWHTRAIMPVIKTYSDTLNFAPVFRDFTADLGRGVIITADPQPLADAPSGTWNLYVRDNDADSWTLVTTNTPSNADLTNNRPRYVGASDDFSHIVFESNGALTPDAPDDGSSKVYEWVNGDLRLVSIVAGVPAVGGAISGAGADHGDGNGASTRRTVSADGSRIVFTAAPTGSPRQGRLYLRIDGEETQHINASERTVPDTVRPALFGSASRDGKRVFFTTTEKLLDADTDTTSDLYMYTESENPATDSNLTLVSVDSEPGDSGGANVQGVLGAGDDGSHVYFAANGALVPDALTGFNGGVRLYHWHNGQIDYVGPAALASPDSASAGTSSLQKLWHPFYGTKAARVTPDGQRLLYTTYRASQQLRNLGEGLSYRDLYLYAAGEGQSRCISCNPRGYETPTGVAGLTAGASAVTNGATVYSGHISGVASAGSDYDNRAITDDGRWVFFSSDQALVAGDVNGVVDAYSYDVANDHLRLLSSGKSGDNSFFIDASADGRDAFFTTRERLVGWDVDNNVDLYDARIGGGFPEPDPQRPPCDGDACQAPSTGDPRASGLGSRAARGRGDLSETVGAAFSLRRLTAASITRLARKGRTTVGVKVGRPGTVRVAMRAKVAGRNRVVARGAKRATRAGTVRVALRLNKAARRQLVRRRTLRTALSVRFTGTDTVRRQTLTLKLKRGARR